MLQLKNLTKDYPLSDKEVVHALRGISISFRRNEFVAILGPSGCGKTTLLNIVGGLDRYTSGDLIIEGKSTKHFGDRDWDTYRNHSIGFVFQSYNLINHISVLQNVELALTISGISKSERKRRAEEALTKVGLGGMGKKKPNQLSGGQCQRVAIARALVNNPEILLADEPTGALDSETSLQIMDLLKEVAHDRLVIMVTHNPDLANKYANRIVRVHDGLIIGDSNPYEGEKEEERKLAHTKRIASKGRKKRTSMSFFTALGLSWNNMMTKKGRTFLVSFAASIGIIGIALVLSLSSSFSNYITDVQQDALSTYPMTVDKVSEAKLTNVIGSANKGEVGEKFPTDGKVNEDSMIMDMLYAFTDRNFNDTKAFKEYLESDPVQEKYSKYWSAVQYDYGLQTNIFAGKGLDGEYRDDLFRLYPEDADTKDSYLYRANTYRTEDPSWNETYQAMYEQYVFDQVVVNLTSTFADYGFGSYSELIDNEELLKNQFEIIDGGRFPEKYDEVILKVDQYNRIDDYLLFGLGLKDPSYMISQIAYTLAPQYGINFLTKPSESQKFSCDLNDFKNMTFKIMLDTQRYKKVSDNKYEDIYLGPDGLPSDEMNDIMNQDYIELKVVGVVRAKPGVTATSLTGAIGYRSELIDQILSMSENPSGKYSEYTVLKDQQAHPDIDMLTGLPFENDQGLELNLAKFGHVDKDTPVSIYIYPTTFEAKDQLKVMITDYNDSVEESKKVTMSDEVDTLMASVQVMVDSITYVLIAFVSISLVVSSIMIAIITYVSVLERTKEIGVLRAIGARKRDIATVFNAETLIIGLAAGLLGLFIAALIDVPIMLVIDTLAELNLVVTVPIFGIIALPIISIILTLVAGLIPSSLAAKKDPVIALRSE